MNGRGGHDAETIITKNKNTYDIIADSFSRTRSFLWADLKPLLGYALTGQRVLDIGCGNGRLYQALQSSSPNYTGFDQSEAMLAIARRRFPGVNFLEGEMGNLPFPDKTFDVVYGIAVFHHVPPARQTETLKEIARVLKPGGYFLMTNWNLFSTWAKNQVTGGNWKLGNGGEYLVPWKDREGRVSGERIYFALSVYEIEKLCVAAGLMPEKQYYSRRGHETSLEKGDNLISILKVR